MNKLVIILKSHYVFVQQADFLANAVSHQRH